MKNGTMQPVSIAAKVEQSHKRITLVRGSEVSETNCYMRPYGLLTDRNRAQDVAPWPEQVCSTPTPYGASVENCRNIGLELAAQGPRQQTTGRFMNEHHAS